MRDENEMMLGSMFSVCADKASEQFATIPQPAGRIVARWFEQYEKTHGKTPSSYLLLLMLAHLLDSHHPLVHSHKEN